MTLPAEVDTSFRLGHTGVRVLHGDILTPGLPDGERVDAVASSDDNHLTMSGGVALALARAAIQRADYVREALKHAPMDVGGIAVAGAHGITLGGHPVRAVFHCAVVDLDGYRRPIEQAIYDVTAKCLDEAHRRPGIRSLLLPLFGAGAAKLAVGLCARNICQAIKDVLAYLRDLDLVYIVVRMPDTFADEDEARRCRERLDTVLREANLVLGTPYSATAGRTSQREFYGQSGALAQVEDVVFGRSACKHVALLGGPYTGRSALLSVLANRNDRRLRGDERGPLVRRVALGRVHTDMARSFLYRALAYSLYVVERSTRVRRALLDDYANADLTPGLFVDTLRRLPPAYRDVVFVADRLLDAVPDAEAFLRTDLPLLESAVRFVFAPADTRLLDALPGERAALFAQVHLGCIEDSARDDWVRALYHEYVASEPSDLELAFVSAEGGRHPFTAYLAASALIVARKQDLVERPGSADGRLDDHDPAWLRCRGNALQAINGIRTGFFEQLLSGLALKDPVAQADLQALSRATAIERDIENEFPRDATPATIAASSARLAQLRTAAAQERVKLHADALGRLSALGCVVGAEDPNLVSPMSRPFAEWLARYYGDAPSAEHARPRRRIEIGLLLSPDGQYVVVQYRASSAYLANDTKELRAPDHRRLLETVAESVRQLQCGDDPGSTSALERVGKLILERYMTMGVRELLQGAARGTCVQLLVDERLNDVPWELALETAYHGEYPFRVGRLLMGGQPRGPANVVPRRPGKLRALIIGDPTGDLSLARAEASELGGLLDADPRFDRSHLLLGREQCDGIAIQSAFSNGAFDLIHYSGHGTPAYWQLADDTKLTTDDITGMLYAKPPALVFSASCASAAGAAGAAPPRFELESFDLASAFLRAGTQAFIGTLWPISQAVARDCVRAFYEELVAGLTLGDSPDAPSLGECLRRAKLVAQQAGGPDWAAFVLYGDPDSRPTHVLTWSE